jgi:acyl carrier protein
MAESNEKILEALRNHLASRGVDGATIVPEAHLLRDLDLDSLDTVEMTLGIEERFGVEIADEELEDITTIADVIDVISKKLPVAS